MSDVVLIVEGVSYGGWKSIQVDRSMDRVAGTFGFLATDIFPGQTEKWQIRMGQECSVEVDGEVLVTGYVGGVHISYSGDSHSFEVRGRDKTADLVDCSHDSTKTEWKEARVSDIVTDLITPLGVELVIDSSVAAKAAEVYGTTFKANEGDTVYESVLRVLKSKAILPITLGDGKLTLTRSGTSYVSDRIELGKNVLTGSYSIEDLDRYSVYIVKAQHSGVDSWDLGSVNQPASRYTDPVVRRTRPLIVFAQSQSTNQQCDDRAEWEARIRAGRSRQLTYTMQDWLQSTGEPWPLNSLVTVEDDFFEVRDTLLIAGVVNLKSDSEGSLTQLRLVAPETYDMLAAPIKIKSAFDF